MSQNHPYLQHIYVKVRSITHSHVYHHISHIFTYIAYFQFLYHIIYHSSEYTICISHKYIPYHIKSIDPQGFSKHYRTFRLDKKYLAFKLHIFENIKSKDMWYFQFWRVHCKRQTFLQIWRARFLRANSPDYDAPLKLNRRHSKLVAKHHRRGRL